jgi:ABC-type branched-subunit amino acid transport system ATPase component
MIMVRIKVRASAMADQMVTPATSQPLLQAIGITKLYGTFVANDHIDLDLHPAQIHALLGENGAGKSTLVKTAYGLIQPNEGELRWLGKKTVLAGPAQARALGIGMVFQHFSPSPRTSRSGCRRASRSRKFRPGSATFRAATGCPLSRAARSGGSQSASASVSRSYAP